MGCGASASASPAPQTTHKPITVMPQPTATAEQLERRGERTFIAVKPDGVQRCLVGEIIGRYERRGLKLVGLKMMQPTKQHAEEHYAEHRGKPFFEKITTAVSSGPMVAMAFEGLNAVAIGRMLLGATDPLKSTPGTIRGDFALEGGRNCCHGSDSVESANRELALWFRPEELVSWSHCTDAWTYE